MRSIPSIVALITLTRVLGRPIGTAVQEATPAPAADPPGQPFQPATGPGGAEFAYDGIRAQHYSPEPDSAAAPTGYWLFEPIAPRRAGTPAAQSPLPRVIFLQGSTATNPEIYHAWLEHLVRRVAYPDWQPWDYSKTNNAETLADTLTAIRAAPAELRSGEHSQPDLEQAALVGHSFGGMLAVPYAALAAAKGLPIPQAILLASPGCWDRPYACGPTPPLTDLSTISATTRLLILAMADDPIVGSEPARLWTRLPSVPRENRDFITYVSDAHGAPALVTDHDIPATTLDNPFDTYDWYGTWKWLDALLACGFADQDCQVALGNAPDQRFMGTWSDGVPVAELIVTDDPGEPMRAAA